MSEIFFLAVARDDTLHEGKPVIALGYGNAVPYAGERHDERPYAALFRDVVKQDRPHASQGRGKKKVRFFQGLS